MAVKPEENNSDKHCTLFQPVFDVSNSNSNRVVRLRHVNTGNYVGCHNGINNTSYCRGCLTLLPKFQPGEAADVCTFIDWESVVMLPDYIRIKGDNGDYLKAMGGDGLMGYFHEADNSSVFDYEVSPSRDGGIRLKSVHVDKYWTGKDKKDWVKLRQASLTVHETNNVFIPTLLDGNRIIMRCLKNGMFCNRPSRTRSVFLAAQANYPDKYCSMEIEEPVISRRIESVKYHLNDARLYNEKILALITDDSINRTQHPITSQLDLKTTVSNTTNWSISVTLKRVVKMTGTLGVPHLIKSGSLEISSESTKSWNWGETETESIEVGNMKIITVPPMTRLEAKLMATRLSYDIPFSYTQRDVLMNGSTKISKKNDGLFTGHNGYGYSFEVFELPLN
ncbi:hypothetical protein MKW92_010383 [Papaver armeniacum]|nr:hypothetical protein MKW92_010383 [Papaver armeniacum]